MFDRFKKLHLGDKPVVEVDVEAVAAEEEGRDEPSTEVATKLCGSCHHRQTTKCLLNGGIMKPNDYCSGHTKREKG